MAARPLYKVDHSVSDADRIANLERRLATEHERRIAAEQSVREAERNASKFHALLLAERIKHLPAKES